MAHAHDSNAELMTRIKYILARRFPPPDSWVDVSPGYRANIHVVVVSPEFKGMDEVEKQELLWKTIDSSDLSDQEKVMISRIMPYSPAELK